MSSIAPPASHAVVVPSYHPTLLLVGRLLLAAVFLVAGIRKAMAVAGSAGYFAKLGFPMPEVVVYVAIVIEIGGALMLIAGWKTRIAAWILAAFVVIATFMAHRFWEFPDAQYANQMNHFLKNAAIVGGMMFVAACGPGSLSADKS
ncbi:MAG TPA: DoxX family protein [Burkholderiales bacterium]|nr:DoxX family protein [Burkholderiales bacterium]